MSIVIISPVLEFTDQIKFTANSIKEIAKENEVEWWIVSPKKTIEVLKIHNFLKKKYIKFYEEKRPSLWGAYNTVINQINCFYIPLSIGDIIYKEGFMKIHRLILQEKIHDKMLIFCSVVKNNKINKARDTWRSRLSTSGFASGHSSACIINKSLHKKYGFYDETFDLAADNYFFEKVYRDEKKLILWKEDILLGKFIGGGISTIDLKKSFYELYRSRVESGRSIIFEKFLYYLRRIKYNV